MKGPIMLDNMAPAVEVGMYLKSLGIESLRINVKVSGLEVLTANESYSVVDVTDNSEVLLCLSIKDRVTNGYSSERSIGVQDQHGELIRKLHPVMVAALKLKGVESVIRLHGGSVCLEFLENVQEHATPLAGASIETGGEG
jgi:hypothetical protein